MHGYGVHHLAHRSVTTDLTGLDRRVAELLKDLEKRPAGLAAVLVNGQGNELLWRRLGDYESTTALESALRLLGVLFTGVHHVDTVEIDDRERRSVKQLIACLVIDIHASERKTILGKSVDVVA